MNKIFSLFRDWGFTTPWRDGLRGLSSEAFIAGKSEAHLFALGTVNSTF